MTSGMGTWGRRRWRRSPRCRRRLTSGPPDGPSTVPLHYGGRRRKARATCSNSVGARQAQAAGTAFVRVLDRRLRVGRPATSSGRCASSTAAARDPSRARNGETGLYRRGPAGRAPRSAGSARVSDALDPGGGTGSHLDGEVGRVPEGQARGGRSSPRPCRCRTAVDVADFLARHDQALFPFPARSRYRGRQDAHRRGHAVLVFPLGPAQVVLFRNPNRAGGPRWLTRRDLS